MINELLYNLDKNVLENIEAKYFFENQQVPRVTEIISAMIHEEYLMKWANGIGFRYKKYETERDRAANIGSIAHGLIEEYIRNKTYSKSDINESNNAYSSFRLWWDELNANNKIEVLGLEQQLVCRYYGGTYDMLISINGKIYLVDFKTSNHVSYKYYLQMAAYKNVLLNEHNINIDGVIILQLDKKIPSYEEYVLNFEIKEHRDFIDLCQQTFLTLCYGYFLRLTVERDYKNIFVKA